MKLKLPFFNRKNYVLFRFYTPSPFAAAHAAPSLTLHAKHETFNVIPKCPREKLHRSMEPSFKTCFGLVSQYKRSITLPMWAEFCVDVHEGQLSVNHSTKGDMKQQVDVHNDRDYLMQKGMVMLKFNSLWAVTTEGDIDSTTCISGQHILNTTGMMIPTGIIDFKAPQHDWNVFNKVDTSYDHTYKIPFAHPIQALFPITEKEIIVETELSHEKYFEAQSGNNWISDFKSTLIKTRQRERSKKT